MCYQDQKTQMAGLTAEHAAAIAANTAFPELTKKLYNALTESLNPHLPVLPALVALVEQVKQKDFGVVSDYNLARLPLSIIGTDKVRYRTQVVEWLHESILSLNMSEITMDNVRKVLATENIALLQGCCCGVYIGTSADITAYYGSDHHCRMDRLRSAIDAGGSPVASVENFADIPVRTMDLHEGGAEARLFERIEELIVSAATSNTSYAWIDQELDCFLTLAGKGTMAI